MKELGASFLKEPHLGAGLVAVSTTLGSLPAGLAFLMRRQLSSPLLVFLGYLASVFYVVAIAASAPLARYTTFLVGKVFCEILRSTGMSTV